MNKEVEEAFNSEQWENTVEAIERAWKSIKEALTPVVERAATIFREFGAAADPQIQKCYGIYKRTKSARIKKKQITRINKLIFKRK